MKNDPYFVNQIALEYFKTLFLDVSARSVFPRTENHPDKFVDECAFFNYSKLPGIINDRFFNLFEKKQPGNYVEEKDFVKVFSMVYMSTVEEKL